MSLRVREVPWGIQTLQCFYERCCPLLRINRQLWYQISVVLLTYIAYTTYHLSRKPISVVKAVLHRNCSQLQPPPNGISPNGPSTWCDWAPFNGTDSNASMLLADLDSSFLFCYAIAMFFSGFIAERVNLRYFLSLGMLASGILSYLLGLAKVYGIHSMSYFMMVQALAGICQTTGWPSVVTVMSNWFGKTKRGVIFGFWNSHTSLGNILGSVIAAAYVEDDWSMSFIMPGLLMGACGFIMFLFLVTHPMDVCCDSSNYANQNQYKKSEDDSLSTRCNIQSSDSGCSGIPEYERSTFTTTIASAPDPAEEQVVTERTMLLVPSHQNHASPNVHQAIGFVQACRIPGVIEFSLSLFFSKLVSYTFLYWLPLYVNASTTMGASLSADLSTLFDVGGIIGAITAGVISDHSHKPATTCVCMLSLAAPMMYVYQRFGATSIRVNILLLIIVGILVNGPYALVTTAVSADLGTHASLEGNSKALATVTAIIDGTGSIGAALGPLLAGYVSNYGWHNVFYMLIGSDVVALLLLIRVVRSELRPMCSISRNSRIE